MPATDSTAALPNTTVLVVDDEAGIRELMARWLANGGYDVRMAANADEAITTRARTTETAQNEVTVSAPAAAPTDSTTGARPGWGCGDTNHKHSGPPGRPGATPPPGCASR